MAQCAVKLIGGVTGVFNKTAITLLLIQVTLFVSKMGFFILRWIALSNMKFCVENSIIDERTQV